MARLDAWLGGGLPAAPEVPQDDRVTHFAQAEFHNDSQNANTPLSDGSKARQNVEKIK